MQQLQDTELWDIYATNTHCHHLLADSFQEISLHKLLQMTYVSWLIHDPGDTAQGHSIYFSSMKANSYFYWWRRAIEALYGDGKELTVETWEWFDQQVQRAYARKGQQDIRLLQDVCKCAAILLDDYQKPGSNHGLPGLMRPVFRCDMFLCGYRKGQTDENHNHAYDYFAKQPSSLEEYVQETEQAIKTAIEKGCVGLKIAIAYERSLVFCTNAKDEAMLAFGSETATSRQKQAFGDFMMFELARIAAKLGVPVQIHTGLGALSGSRAIGLRDLIANNPQTKFDLFHASYPWCDDVLGLAHNFSNVYIDLCWLPLISTSRAISFLREALELVPENRILWGCDTWTAEESYGARMAMHRCLLSVLNDFIREGAFNHQDAIVCARRILCENAAELYKLF